MASLVKKYFRPIIAVFLFVFNGITCTSAWAGTSYVFIPQTDNAVYTDTANWMNGNYPGNNISEDDSILFKTGNGFSVAIINTPVTLFGNCEVDSGVILYINSSFNLAGIGFPSFSAYLIKARAGSTVVLNGQLTSFGRSGVFDGDVIINGTFLARTTDMNDQTPGCEFDFNAHLIVNGHLGFVLSHISCHFVTVNSTGSIGGFSGYEFWTTSLGIDSLYNSGSLHLSEVYFTCSVLQNEGSMFTYTISANSVVNNGDFTISDTSPVQVSDKQSFIAHLVNSGGFEIWLIKLHLATPFVNSQSFFMYDGAVLADSIVNNGSFTVEHTSVIEWQSFINNGSFVWTAIDANSEDKLQANFVNNGVFTHYGKLRMLDGSFTNTGTVNIIPQ
jgi:hypothetical protein